MEVYLWSGGALVIVAILASFRMHVEQHRRIAALNDRLSQLSAGVSLLTDAVESGLRDVAIQVERMNAQMNAPKPKGRATTDRRVSKAAVRGRSIQEIAAMEQMSESEVLLRLQLSGAAPAFAKAMADGQEAAGHAAAGREQAHATVR